MGGQSPSTVVGPFAGALTTKGETALSAERAQWRQFAGGVQAVLGWSA